MQCTRRRSGVQQSRQCSFFVVLQHNDAAVHRSTLLMYIGSAVLRYTAPRRYSIQGGTIVVPCGCRSWWGCGCGLWLLYRAVTLSGHAHRATGPRPASCGRRAVLGQPSCVLFLFVRFFVCFCNFEVGGTRYRLFGSYSDGDCFTFGGVLLGVL
jgi:hypothetical protein